MQGFGVCGCCGVLGGAPGGSLLTQTACASVPWGFFNKDGDVDTTLATVKYLGRTETWQCDGLNPGDPPLKWSSRIEIDPATGCFRYSYTGLFWIPGTINTEWSYYYVPWVSLTYNPITGQPNGGNPLTSGNPGYQHTLTVDTPIFLDQQLADAVGLLDQIQLLNPQKTYQFWSNVILDAQPPGVPQPVWFGYGNEPNPPVAAWTNSLMVRAVAYYNRPIQSQGNSPMVYGPPPANLGMVYFTNGYVVGAAGVGSSNGHPLNDVYNTDTTIAPLSGQTIGLSKQAARNPSAQKARQMWLSEGGSVTLYPQPTQPFPQPPGEYIYLPSDVGGYGYLNPDATAPGL